MFWRISYSRSIGVAATSAVVQSYSDPAKARKSLRTFYPFLRKEMRPATEQEIAKWHERQEWARLDMEAEAKL